MKKSLFLVVIYLLSHVTFAAEEPTEPLPLDPKYEGEYPMVLVGNGSYMYASLLSSYKEPKNVQLIYEIDNKNLALMNLVRDADLVTILPKPFNLEHLLRAEHLKITADVYMGHFARGGILTYQGIELDLTKQLYLRMLDDPEKSHIRHKYDSVMLQNDQRLLVHQIQTPPSYDQIILLFDNVNCITEFAASSAVPKINEIYRKLAFCGSMHPLYIEYQDFQE
jgi:hypothetical protein